MRKTAFNGADMLATAQGVMAARGAIVAAAATSPLKADYAELGRMVPEKVAAFTSASCATTTILWETGAAMEALRSTARRHGDALALAYSR